MFAFRISYITIVRQPQGGYINMKKSLLVLAAGMVVSMATGCSGNNKRILIYATAEEERIAYVQEELNKKFPDYEIVIQYSGTGALVSKLQGEGPETDCDIIFELEANNMEKLMKQDANFFYELKDYDFSQFTDAATSYGHKYYAPTCMTYGGVVINKKVLADAGVPVPTTYADLLNPAYHDLIEMPNPKASGTGYLFYNGVVSHNYATNGGNLAQAKADALTYFNSLSANVKEFTSSGSAPIKAANRGDIGVGLAMLWQCVEYGHNNADLDYTFLDYGAPSNLYVMSIINGHEKRKPVKEVFDYLFNELNKKEVEKFVPDPIYKEFTPEDSTYPTGVSAIEMHGLYDPEYKADLLDSWNIN